MAYVIAKFEVVTSKGQGGDLFTKRNLTFAIDLGGNVIQNVAQYPRHHVTYAYATSEFAMFIGLGKDAFTRKYMI